MRPAKHTRRVASQSAAPTSGANRWSEESYRRMKINTHENWALVVHHLDDAHTTVEITDASGVRLSMPYFHVPTSAIPIALRRIGSRFLLRWRAVWPNDSDSVADIREQMAHAFEVIAVPPNTPQPQGGSPPGGAGSGEMVD